MIELLNCNTDEEVAELGENAITAGKRLAALSYIRALAQVRRVIVNIVSNVKNYPFIYIKINRLFPDMPEDVQARITELSGERLDDDGASEIMILLDDNSCDACGRGTLKCKCEE